MNKDLSHLNDDQIDNLIKRYYDGESASKLIEEFEITVSVSRLYTLFPPIIYPNYECEYCSSHLVIDRFSKAMNGIKRYERELYCPNCGHKQYTENCSCENCKKKRIELKEKQLRQIQDLYSRNKGSVNFEDLPFRTKVFLGTLCRELLSENFYEIRPQTESKNPIAPTDKLLSILYKDLIYNKAIKVSPRSSLEAFPQEDDFPNTFYTYQVIYNLNLVLPKNKNELISEILNPQYYTSNDSDEAYELWKEIATEECLEYLLHQLNSVGFNDFNPGEKTNTVIQTLLETFSVAQIYGIIWKSVADASKLYLERNITKAHAANSVIGACQRLAERAVLNKWDMTQYSRIKELPQSVLSEFFFNKVVKIGEMGFKLPPSYI